MSLRHKEAFLFTSTALILSLPRAMADGPFVCVTESATWQDNVTYAPSGNGVRGALGLESGFQVDWLRSLDFSTTLTGGFAGDIEVCTEYSGLDNLCLGPTVEVRHKFGLGPLAPVVYAGLLGSAYGFEDPERSKIEGDFLFGYSQRLSDEFQVALDGRLGSFDARDIVFCGNYASLDAAMNWDVTETWRVRLLGGWRNGDLVSDYTAEESPYGWEAIDPNTEYLPGAWHYVRTFNEPFVAYRVSTVTWSYGAAVSPAIGPHTSASLQYVHYLSPGIDRYVDNVVSLSLTHRF
jgi:hypothetical protein